MNEEQLFYIVIILIGLLFFKDQLIPLLNRIIEKMFGISVPNVKDNQYDELKTALEMVKTIDTKMTNIIDHFNHETTAHLGTIANNQGKMITKLEKISNKQDVISDEVALIKYQQEKWREYGIKIKK